MPKNASFSVHETRHLGTNMGRFLKRCWHGQISKRPEKLRHYHACLNRNPFHAADIDDSKTVGCTEFVQHAMYVVANRVLGQL